jgi:two-component sensor histidine kinase
MASFIKSTFLIKGSSQININAKGCSLDIDRAIPLGLIINELLTNAFKYAQVDGQELKVDISIFTRKEEFIIKVSDNGLGINSENDMNEAKSLGMRLIKRLTKQLKGNISYKYDQGAKFELHFLQEA